MGTLEDDDFYSDENLSKVDDMSKGLSDEKESSTVEQPNGVVEDESSLAKTYSFKGSFEVEESEDDVENDIMLPEERLSMFADSILSCCIKHSEIRNYALDKLMLVGNPRLFRNENYILFSVLLNFRGKLRSINIDDEFIKLFLNRNRDLLHKSRQFIDINAYGEIDGSVELGYISGVIKHYKRLLSMEELSKVDFETCFEKYLIEFKALETSKAFSQGNIILTEGLKVGRKTLFGFEDSTNFVKRRLAEIEGLCNLQEGTGFTTARELLLEEKQSVKPVKIADFDELEALNKMYGGIYTGMFYQVLAPPKTGKTKFCARLVHTAAIKFGTNVSVWAAEGGKDDFLRQIRAIHFDHIYNRGVAFEERKFGVSQEVIKHDTFPSDELRQLELTSKLDFASNLDYGSVDFIDRPFEVETFLDDIDTSVRSNNSQLLVIDYLQIIGTATNKSERERVSDAYINLLAYCKKNNIAVLSPGQYKQETVDRLSASSKTVEEDMRTSGGTSAEVLRTPDVIFAFWASTADLRNNTMKILSMPCRFYRAEAEVDVLIDLESCRYKSISK